MKQYKEAGADAGVTGYESGSDFIRLRFKDGSVYRYTYDSTGVRNVERMKALAAAGSGLTTFVNQHVGAAYDQKEREGRTARPSN